MARSISVVVPFYEKRQAFKKTFSELLLQLDHDDEIIVADDHSPSGIGACNCVKELTVVRPPKLGAHIYRLNTLRNLGIKHAKHDAIMILDPDCIPNPHFLENARRIFDPSVLFAGRIDFMKADGTLDHLDPRRETSSRWCDWTFASAGMIWGGVMYFSKSRTALVGHFDTDYDGGWGSEDHDFGERCYSSGMRMRYEFGLAVRHQWHPENHPNQQRNLDLWEKKRAQYPTKLEYVTPYRPTVGVLIVTLKRPYYIDQVMRGVFRTRIPLKVRLVNQGDKSPKQMEALKWWRGRWAVEIVELPKPESIEAIRAQTMKHYARTCKYMIVLDDDILPKPGSIEALLRALQEHPEYHAIAGGIIEKGMSRMLGGYIIGTKDRQYYALPFIKGVAETSYISSGFTAFRLDPLVPFDGEYEFGWGDWDWANELKRNGLRMAVCGDALAYHKHVITSKGPEHIHDSPDYMKIRYNSARHQKTSDRFLKKWGYRPKDPKLWDGPVIEGTLR